MNNFIEITDNALSSEECKVIIEHYESESATGRHDTKMNIYDKTIRDCTTVGRHFDAIDDQPSSRVLLNALREPLREYVLKNKELRYDMAPFIPMYGYNIQKYEPGQAYHKPHAENDGINFQRVLVWQIYLNTVTDKGGTYFHQWDTTVDAVEGRCVIWPAYFTHFHNGIMSPTQTKYIATGWFVIEHLITKYPEIYVLRPAIDNGDVIGDNNMKYTGDKNITQSADHSHWIKHSEEAMKDSGLLVDDEEFNPDGSRKDGRTLQSIVPGSDEPIQMGAGGMEVLVTENTRRDKTKDVIDKKLARVNESFKPKNVVK